MAMAAAASLLPACAAPTLPGRAFRPRRNSTPTASLSCDGGSRGRGVGLGVILGGGRAQGVRRNAAAETYVPGSGKYIAPDYLVVRSCPGSTRIWQWAWLRSRSLLLLRYLKRDLSFLPHFMVAEEGDGQGTGGAGEGGEEGAPHRGFLRDVVRTLRPHGPGHRDGICSLQILRSPCSVCFSLTLGNTLWPNDKLAHPSHVELILAMKEGNSHKKKEKKTSHMFENIH